MNRNALETQFNRPNSKILIIPAGITSRFPDNKKRAKLALLIALIYSLMRTPEKVAGHWINIHSSDLTLILGNCYRDIVELAKSLGLIEINERYCSGFDFNTGEQLDTEPFPKSYRLSEQFRHFETEIFEVTKLPDRKRARLIYAPDRERLKPTGMHLFSNLKKVDFDADGFLQGTELQNHRIVTEFGTGNLKISRCDFGRVHTILTNTNRECRRFLSWYGENMVEVDVSACQLLTVGIMATNLNNINRHHNPRPTKGKTRATILRTMPDVATWLELCEQRLINQAIREEVLKLPDPTFRRNSQLIDLRILTDAEFKQEVIRPLFSKLERLDKLPVFQVIEHRFPTIAAWIKRSKSARFKRWSTKDRMPHCRTAALCQRFESLTMIDDGIGVMMREHPDIGVLTVHDSYVVPESFAPQAKILIENVWAPFGVEPLVRIEH